MALVATGLLALPAWANAWTKKSLVTNQVLLNAAQAETLTELVDTLIPTSDTPGAKALNVPDFVQKMLADCYEPAVQQRAKEGLAATDEIAKVNFGQAFVACDTTQRLAVLGKLQASAEANQKEFFALIKNLTIQGYTTSEYVMTKFLNYNMIPGHYYGCVPAPVAAK